MKTNIEPIGRTVLVEAVVVSSTIQLPSSVEADRYTVVAVGTGKDIPNIKKGDTVILAPGVVLVPIKDTKFSLTSVDNVLAKVK